jgi:hypothetical protein
VYSARYSLLGNPLEPQWLRFAKCINHEWRPAEIIAQRRSGFFQPDVRPESLTYDKSNSAVQLKSINESEPHGEDTIHRMAVYTLVIMSLRLSQFFYNPQSGQSFGSVNPEFIA